ncbi:MAG: hypothetical protein ACRC2T_00425 [Thermoguttaceae bacterium]
MYYRIVLYRRRNYANFLAVLYNLFSICRCNVLRPDLVIVLRPERAQYFAPGEPKCYYTEALPWEKTDAAGEFLIETHQQGTLLVLAFYESKTAENDSVIYCGSAVYAKDEFPTVKLETGKAANGQLLISPTESGKKPIPAEGVTIVCYLTVTQDILNKISIPIGADIFIPNSLTQKLGKVETDKEGKFTFPALPQVPESEFALNYHLFLNKTIEINGKTQESRDDLGKFIFVHNDSPMVYWVGPSDLRFRASDIEKRILPASRKYEAGLDSWWHLEKTNAQKKPIIMLLYNQSKDINEQYNDEQKSEESLTLYFFTTESVKF